MFPEIVNALKDGKGFRPLGVSQPMSLSNLDKPFFPDGYTKGDLIQYYASISPVLLAHLRDRAIVMSRYPEGSEGASFYEKRAPGHQPSWMKAVKVHTDSVHGEIEYLLAEDREALMWFANMGCIEIHPWHSQYQRPETPDYAIFDFDPAEGSTWDQVVAGAKLLRVALQRLELQGYPKLSGSKGLHVYVPLEAEYSYTRVRRFVEAVGRLLVAANPGDLTMDWDIPQRRGKVFIDHNRNAYGQTIASVYSIRPRPGAPVSAPIRWDEVDNLHNGEVTMANLWERLQRYGDLFAPVAQGGQRLEEAEATLGLTG
jgi:bifunctional non-homologous end joining protein LigD